VSKLRFAPPAVLVERLSGGRLLLRSPQPLAEPARVVGDVLEKWAASAPDRVFLAEPSSEGDGFRRVTYAEAARAARSLGQALLDRGLSPRRPLVVLSENSIDHALLALGAMHAGVPVAPVSTAYSLLSRDHEKLRAIVRLVRPGLVFASDGAAYGAAIEAAVPADVELVVGCRPPAGRKAALLDELRATAPREELSAAFAATGPDTVAKVLFTSGSTGEPKGVLNTQRMLCSNQQAIFQMWPFLADRPPVVVDWLPWSHTFGGNHNFYMVLWHGGTLYVDRGKPAPGLIDRTIAILSRVSPTLYFNVPRGYDMLLPHLENDEGLRRTFFRDLDVLFYAAAALPQSLWDRLEKASIDARGERVSMVSAWGATETAPMVTSVHFHIDRPGVIGLPAPGTELLMVPSGGQASGGGLEIAGGKWELRVRGPNVTPGYWDHPELTAAAFDEEGFYRIGDAGKFRDPEDPTKGLVFDGRIAEDFKLTSGTWVHVGTLRTRLIAACAPVVEDAVITGHDRDFVGALLFPSESGVRRMCADAPADTPLSALLQREDVRERVRQGLAGGGSDAGSSMRVTRALFLSTPPSIDLGEITDKGYLNQRRVRERRAADVQRLHAEPPEECVVCVTEGTGQSGRRA
jgi:feruloyl-CoA synthase